MTHSYKQTGHALHRNASGLADIVIPVLDNVEPPIIDGYVPQEHLASDLVIWIPELWPDAAPDESAFDILEVVWTKDGNQGVPPFIKRYDGPITLEFPFPITISREYLSDGVVELKYRITDHAGIPSTSDPRILYLDTTPPNNNVAPQDPVLPTGLVDEDYLAKHSTVDLTVPRYNGRRSFDSILYYISDTSPPPASAPDGEVVFPDEESPLIVPIPGIMFRKYPSGTQYVYIRLQDRSGNRGPRSDEVPIAVNLLPSPVVLKPPVVPAMVDGLINLYDARIGVSAVVEYDHWAIGDFIHFKWGNTLITPHSVTQSPSTVVIPWNKLIAAGEGPGSSFASYHVTRGPDDDPTPPSSGTPIRWNYTTAGDPNRDAPALLNRDLSKAILFGEGSKTDNYIDVRDKDQRIYARVPLYNRPVTGEVMELYFGDFPNIGTPVARYVVNTDIGDADGRVVEFSDIPWSAIEAMGENEKFSMFYTTFNGFNEQLAGFSEVVLDVVPPIIFERVNFTSANSNYFLNCLSNPPMWDYIPMQIPYHPIMREKDKIILEWHGYEEFSGTGPIAETRDTLEKILTREEAENGCVFKQEKYEEKIKPIKSPDPQSLGSSASATYTLKRGDRVIGSSRVRFVKIDRRNGTQWCGPDGNGPE